MVSTRPVVLLVDDDPDTLEMYEAGLASDGFRAVTTRDPASVGLQVEAIHPDVIVTDLLLTGASGWNVVERLRTDERARSIPIVLLTGSVGPEITKRASALGCAAVLTKPCLPDDLGATLRKVLHPSI